MSRSREFIDAYAHCGVSKYRPLPELEKAMSLARVTRAVLVQHLGEFDNSYIEGIVVQDPKKFAGVCLVDYTDPGATRDLRRWASTGNIRGTRFLLESLESNEPLWREAVELELNIVVYDPDGIASRVGDLIAFMERNPDACVILSHLGVPNQDSDPGLRRHREILNLSEYPRVFFQVSGMHMFCAYPYREMWPIIEQGSESFGADRMLWGGNYPVVGTDEDYIREVEQVRSGGLPIPPGDLSKVTSETALKLWFQ